MIPAILGV